MTIQFHSVDNDIYVRRDDEDAVKTLTVVGGSFSKVGLAREIADVLNRHYGRREKE